MRFLGQGREDSKKPLYSLLVQDLHLTNLSIIININNNWCQQEMKDI